jgi:hypothetical protein
MPSYAQGQLSIVLWTAPDYCWFLHCNFMFSWVKTVNTHVLFKYEWAIAKAEEILEWKESEAFLLEWHM